MELAPVAFLAGVIAVSSPCCVPLIPGYLSYISGVTDGTRQDRRRVLGTASLFVLGFAVVFTALGAGASLLGSILLGSRPALLKVSGIFVIVMGLIMLGVVRIPILYRERRLDMRRVRSGPAGAFPLGMAFAFGWTPCIGPVLAAVLTTAAATQTAAKGAGLLAIYSLGMGVPFMLMALGFSRAGRNLSWLKRHALKLERAGGGLLIAMGVLIITGYWTRMFAPLIRLFARSGWPPI